MNKTMKNIMIKMTKFLQCLESSGIYEKLTEYINVYDLVLIPWKTYKGAQSNHSRKTHEKAQCSYIRLNKMQKTAKNDQILKKLGYWGKFGKINWADYFESVHQKILYLLDFICFLFHVNMFCSFWAMTF